MIDTNAPRPYGIIGIFFALLGVGVMLDSHAYEASGALVTMVGAAFLVAARRQG